MVRSGPNANGIIIEGANELPPRLSIDWIDSRSEKILGQGEIILGKQLGNLLKTKKNKIIYVQYLDGTVLRKIKSFKIVGFYNSGLSEYDKTLAYIGIKDAQTLLGYNNDSVTGLVFYSKDKINQKLPNVSYPYVLETWYQRHALLFEWIQIQRWPAFIMFGLIVFVGIVNIISALSMIIIEKKAQIGILVAQGFSRSKIKMLFMMQGGLIGILGSLLGGLTALLLITLQLKFKLLTISEEIYFMDKIPMAFDKPIFMTILILSYIFCMIASWWPSKAIYKLKPAECLLYE